MHRGKKHFTKHKLRNHMEEALSFEEYLQKVTQCLEKLGDEKIALNNFRSQRSCHSCNGLSAETPRGRYNANASDSCLLWNRPSLGLSSRKADRYF